jgi:hypothetical protein
MGKSKGLYSHHGLIKTPEYLTWQSIKTRCYNKNHKDYNYYGARGITVCERWKNCFKSFYKDMGARPSKLHSIDRINGSLGYSPENCKWSTKKEQSENRKNSVMVKIGREIKNLSVWLNEFDITWSSYKYRMKNGMSMVEAITSPKRQGNRRKSMK